MSQRIPEALFEDARLIFRNFSGSEGRFNPAGRRNFCILLEQDRAEQMIADGWNVKLLRSKDPEDPPQPYVQVSVNFEGPRPPTVVLITSRGRTTLPEVLCAMLDYADIQKVDLILNPYSWEVSGKSGVKAYLKSIYVTIREDALERKYADIPEIGTNEQLAISSGPQQAWDYEGEVVEDEFNKALGR